MDKPDMNNSSDARKMEPGANKPIDSKNKVTQGDPIAKKPGEMSTNDIDTYNITASGSNFGKEDYSSPSTSPPRKMLIAAVKKKLADEENMARIALAHEIAINDDFRLSSSSKESTENTDPSESDKKKMENAVRKVVQQAFWDCVRAGIESDPPKYDHAFILLQEIKNILLSLLPRNRTTSIHKSIEEVMDMELLQQQAENEALDVRSTACFIIDIMAAICAPARDEQVAALRSFDDVVDLFKEIHKVLDQMKIDYANFAIQSVRPHIKQQQFEYERSTFATLVQSSPDGLKRTRGWISATYDEIKRNLDTLAEQMPSSTALLPSSTDRSSNESKNEQKEKFEKMKKSALSPMSILKNAYIKLLSWNYEEENFPETLQMDKKRFAALRLQVEHLVLVSSAMITACGVFNQPLASHQAYLTSLKDVLLTISAPESDKNIDFSDLLGRISLQIWDEAVKFVDGKGPEVEKCITPEKKAILQAKINALSSRKDHPVYKVLYKRTVEYLGITSDLLGNRTSPAQPDLPAPPAGMSFVASDLINASVQYAKLVNLNQTIYGPFYVPILREILDIPKTPDGKELATNESNNGKNDVPKGADVRDPNEEKRRKNRDEEQKPVYKVTGSLDDLD